MCVYKCVNYDYVMVVDGKGIETFFFNFLSVFSRHDTTRFVLLLIL